MNGPEPVRRTSVEKVRDTLSGAADVEVLDEEQAQMTSMLRMAGPFAARMLPSDPAELDAMLLGLARFALEHRSDGAWRPETIAQLFSDMRAHGAPDDQEVDDARAAE